jgi:hypothetical protein
LTFTFTNVNSPSASDESDEDDAPPVHPLTTHAPFDMTDTNAPLTPCLPYELCNMETFYNPKPGDQGNIALLTQSHDVIEDEMFAYPYKEPVAAIETSSDDVEFVMLIYLNMIVIPSLLLRLCQVKRLNIGGSL